MFAGLSAGFILGSKYTGLWLIGVLALSLLPGRSPLLAARTIAPFVGTAILVAAPWYLRNWIEIGDPLYPVLKGLAGNDEARWAIERLQRDVPTSGLSWASSPSARHRPREPSEPIWGWCRARFADATRHCRVAAGALRVPLLRPWAIAVASYIPIWMAMTGVMRYLYPIFPLAALGIAWTAHKVIEHLRLPMLGTAALFMLAVVPLPQSLRILDSLYVGSDVTALFSGTLSKDDYLARRIAYYPAVQWMNTHTSLDARVLYRGETRLLYLDRPVSFSSAYDHTEIAHLLAPDAPHFFSQLRNMGITHIMINGREIERLRAGYEYLPLQVETEARLRTALADCHIVFRKSGVQICELPR